MQSCPKCLNSLADTAVACEYCGVVLDQSVIARAEGAGGARIPTVVESPGNLPPVPPPASSYRPSPPPPLPGSEMRPGSLAGRRGQTVYRPPSTAHSDDMATPRAAARKVIGILVTYSWRPEGQVFPVREGRNLIGRGEECEICVPDDPAMSQVNSHITFRQNFVVGDMVSMSGTDLNGEPLEEQFRPLGNYAQIRTGSTYWTFVMIDPRPGASGL